MSNMSCPTCRKSFDTEKTEAMPFCSARCKQIDLGLWLGEEISMPVDIEQSMEEETFSSGTDWDEH